MRDCSDCHPALLKRYDVPGIRQVTPDEGWRYRLWICHGCGETQVEVTKILGFRVDRRTVKLLPQNPNRDDCVAWPPPGDPAFVPWEATDARA